MILAFSRYEREISCFDAEWLSCHQHEKEILFFGGDSILQIRNIHKFEGTWKSFGVELKAIQWIRSLANGISITFEMARSWKLREMIFQMISSIVNSDGGETNIDSPYVRQLLTYQIRNTSKRVVYDLVVLAEEYRFLHSIFMENVDRRIPNFVNLCTLFPRATEVVIEVPILFEISNLFMESLINDIPQFGKSINLELQWPDGSYEMVNAAWFKFRQHAQTLSALGVSSHDSIEQSRISMTIPEQIPQRNTLDLMRRSSSSVSGFSTLSVPLDNELESDSSDFEIDYPTFDLHSEPDHTKFAIVSTVVSMALSAADFVVSILLLIFWFSLNRVVFFGIGLGVLALAKCASVAAFYAIHRPKDKWSLLLSLFLTFPLFPFYSFLIYIAGDNNSPIRNIKKLNWKIYEPASSTNYVALQ